MIGPGAARGLDAYEVVVGTAVVVTGWLVGAESASWGLLLPVVARLEPSAQVRMYQGMLRTYGRITAVLMPLTAALLVAATITAPDDFRRDLCAAAAVATGLVVVASATLLAPINRLTEIWDPDVPPPTWRADRRRWRRFQGLRALLLVFAFACLVMVVSPD